MRTNQRRWFPLVYRSHQYRFLALTLFYISSIVALLFLALFVPDIIQMQDESVNIEIRRMAADKVLTLHARLWPAVIAMICFIGMHSFIEFHRFIGPVYRFKKAFEKVGNGDLTQRVKLRSSDFLKEEEKAFNRMMDSLSGNIIDANTSGSAALDLLDRLAPQFFSGNQPAGCDDADVNRLRQHLVTLIETIDRFHLPVKSGETDVNDRV